MLGEYERESGKEVKTREQKENTHTDGKIFVCFISYSDELSFCMLYEDFTSFRITWDFCDNFVAREGGRGTREWAVGGLRLSCKTNRHRDRRHVTLPSL